MDGVLLDNLAYHLSAWRQLGRELGRSLTNEEIRSVFGQRNLEMLTNLIGLHFHEEEADRHAERKEELYRTMIRQRIRETAVPGVSGFLNNLRQEGLRIALATSGPSENAELVLTGLGIADLFTTVITGVDVTEGKPDPEIFLLAARRLGLPPSDCVVFEDSVAGVQAALRARCLCVGVSTTHNRLELEGMGVHYIIPNFRALSVDMLRQIYRANQASLASLPGPRVDEDRPAKHRSSSGQKRGREEQRHYVRKKSYPKSRNGKRPDKSRGPRT